MIQKDCPNGPGALISTKTQRSWEPFSFIRRFGRPGCALNRPTWFPIKGSSASVSTVRSAIVVRQRFSGIPATDTDIISAQHFWTGGLETAGPGCYDAIAIARIGERVPTSTPILPVNRHNRRSERKAMAALVCKNPVDFRFIGIR